MVAPKLLISISILLLVKLFTFVILKGVYLPSLCQPRGDNKRRGMSEIWSSGYVAPGPMVPAKLVANGSPSMAPSPTGPY
ncbi:hypothetical protein Hanom_Chr12g01144181 [Helianthus anomalus]